MLNILLAIHVIITLLLIAVILMQRSEGGGLGMGGGAGGNVKAAARGGIDGIGRFTWMLATAFIVSALVLTIYTARSSGTGSILDQLDQAEEAQSEADASGEGTTLDSLPLLPSEQPTQ